MKNPSFFTLAAILLTVIVVLTAQVLPDDSTTHYAGSGLCVSCHNSLQDSKGEDVSIGDDWRSTMMANAAKDPLWQLKVYSETKRNPDLAEAIEDKCATCHMPMARFEEVFLGGVGSIWQGGFLSKENQFHRLAMDGVSCSLCHQISQQGFGTEGSYSGHFSIDPETQRPDRHIFGPYSNPMVNPMRNQAQFTPTHSEHIAESGLCATCHTLYTPVIDDRGNHIGDFPEQTPYLEWRHSTFAGNGTSRKSCQDCHMPRASGGATISNRPARGLPARSPFFKHHFVGGNTVLLGVLSRYTDELELTASAEQIAVTKIRTEHQLQSQTATITITNLNADARTLTVGVQVQNNTGHKFPTGFPSSPDFSYASGMRRSGGPRWRRS